ncbi:Electron transport complex, RnfABCDGE type, G subunit subfamily [Alloalcanivorax dieselolei B5]|uniref:Ion-translocating oxidoreductase complex subunit G n=1 Tax=Alcanivorax dieselolei (strain DSM 16502 / CGMCC 1.3690 / MCCC 1A00001 / B-5) TaxID=930169 RepID=K0CHS5_ALCDB|nr:electron transport complex subunit RsxG [Alloalcanivorax dieselolei]AFT71232.1 Electron transport complex, RnfABCDGE type, G subunit subfamily [Alloalcanivorax dieselolei B5]GGJ94080.1 electron transport complex subunit G [Alloalcanivorax dieselolei]
MIGQAITRNAVILGLFAIGTAATLALTNQATRQRVECNRQSALADALAQVMPPARHDNPLLDDSITVTDPLLGHGEHQLYRARLGGEASGAVLEAVAPDGYGGDIRLIVGVDHDGTILGVRVVPPHNETPGLGDNIEIRKSDWILGFNGASLEQPSTPGWAVKKDGGRFDSFTGATITPRAVVSAVHGALRYYQAHGDEVFKTPAQAQTTESCDG